MTQSYKIISVDAATMTMVVEFTDDVRILQLNIPVPNAGTTADQQIKNYWPAVTTATSNEADAASALIGQTLTPQAISLGDVQRTQSNVIAAGVQAQLALGYQSDALHPGGVDYTYPATAGDQINMIASVTDAIRTPPDWATGWHYSVGDSVASSGGRLLCTSSGVSGNLAPTDAGEDGDVTWAAWTTPFLCADENGNIGLRQHTANQIQQAGSDGKAFILAVQIKRATLLGEIGAALDIPSVQAIGWSFP